MLGDARTPDHQTFQLVVRKLAGARAILYSAGVLCDSIAHPDHGKDVRQRILKQQEEISRIEEFARSR